MASRTGRTALRSAMWLFGALALSAFAGEAPAPMSEPKWGFIHGIAVQAGTGSPLPGVTIACSRRGDENARSAFSGEDGRFSIWDLEPGTYSVTAYFENVRVACKAFKLGPSSRVRLRIEVPPSTDRVREFRRDCRVRRRG